MGGKPPREFERYMVPFRLQSFMDAQKWKDGDYETWISGAEMVLLDSGAFSFISGKNIGDLKGYIEKYVDFIKKNEVKYFFEVDIDTVIGVTETTRIREELERQIGRRSIPVFHSARGLNAWKQMVREYDYVAIGTSGLTSESRWARREDVMNQLIYIAHESGCKVHGLGFTKLTALNENRINFDSVDSTSWLGGARYAKIYKFTGSKMIMTDIKGRSPGRNVLNAHNCKEWVKFVNFKRGKSK